MFEEYENYYKITEFEDLNVVTGYSKKVLGNMSPFCSTSDAYHEENRKSFLKQLSLNNKHIIYARQTHSNNIVYIDSNTDKYIYDDVDGFITKRNDVVLCTFYADCLPIYVYDKNKHIAAIIHSGWQGTYNEILKTLINKLVQNFECNLDDLIVAMGIGISCDEYQVGDEFYEKFISKFTNYNFVDKCFKKLDKFYFDNMLFNYYVALDLGINNRNIILSDECTSNDKFHSFRRDKSTSGRAMGIISIK